MPPAAKAPARTPRKKSQATRRAQSPSSAPQSAQRGVQGDAMVRIRTSERRDFKRCPQRWAWTWLDGLVSRTHKDALWFGHGVHVALADWYGKQGRRRGPLPAETWAKWCGDEYRRLRVGETFDEQQYVDAKELGTVMLTGYVDEYGADDWMHVVAREQTFEIVVQRADGTTFLYNGTFDLVFRDLRNGQLWLGEHKTAKQISEAHLTLDDQGGSYLWVATEVLRSKGVLKSNERLHGVMYNFLRKQLPDERPRDAQGYATNMPKKEHYLAALPGKVHPKMTLDVMHGKAEEHGVVVLGDRSAKQPKPNFERFHIWRNDRERVVMAQRVLAEEQHMSAVRSGALPIFKTPTRDCSWDCDHYQMCELHEQAGDWEEFRDVQYKHRDPYADHRKGADEGL